MPKKRWLFYLVLPTALILLLSPLYLFGAGKQKEIASLKELIDRYDSSSCRECHGEIYAQWEKSHHARPLMGLDGWIFMSAPNGQKLFSGSKFYMPQAGDGRGTAMVLGPDKKLGLLRDTSIQPFRPKEETFEIPVPPGIREVTVAVRLTYQPRPGNIYLLHSIDRKVSISE